MTNHERYQRAFSTLHASEAQWMEDSHMKQTKKHYFPKAVTICAVVVLVVALAGIAYAADVGGIQRTVQIWMNGDQTDAVLEVKDGEYVITFEGENGETHELIGEGVALDNPFSQERPLTEDEILESLNMPDVQYLDDGRVMLYYHSQSLDITNKFNNGICYVTLKDGGETMYVTVKYQDGFATSNERYPDPKSFD